MKKALIIEITITALCCLLLFLMLGNIKNHDVMIKISDISELSNNHAKIDTLLRHSEGDNIENQYKKIQLYEDLNANLIVFLAQSTGEAELYNQCSLQSVIVERIIEGETELSSGMEIQLQSCDSKCHGFYFEEKDTYERRIARLPALGYQSDECPDYYSRALSYRSDVNLMKKQHLYLIMCYEIKTEDTTVYRMPFSLSYFDLDSDYSKPVITKYGYNADYCDYINNEIFADSQEAVDDFYNYKNKILKEYNLR